MATIEKNIFDIAGTHVPMRVIPIDVNTPFGRGLVESIENVDDDSRFISVEEFMKRYGHLIPKDKK